MRAMHTYILSFGIIYLSLSFLESNHIARFLNYFDEGFLDGTFDSIEELMIFLWDP